MSIFKSGDTQFTCNNDRRTDTNKDTLYIARYYDNLLFGIITAKQRIEQAQIVLSVELSNCTRRCATPSLCASKQFCSAEKRDYMCVCKRDQQLISELTFLYVFL